MDSHHTQDQIVAAFAKAPQILAQLTAAGVALPYFELFADASGTLWLGKHPTVAQLELACTLVQSSRPNFDREPEMGITFCCGLVAHVPLTS